MVFLNGVYLNNVNRQEDYGRVGEPPTEKYEDFYMKLHFWRGIKINEVEYV